MTIITKKNVLYSSILAVIGVLLEERLAYVYNGQTKLTEEEQMNLLKAI